MRIGSRAYLHPGSAFAGGTLARDVCFLTAIGKDHGIPTSLLQGVTHSNSSHRLWAERRLSELLGIISEKTVAILGLTYKPGTNTLRQSAALEVCRWLLDKGADVQAFDPAITELPYDLKQVHLMNRAELALVGADAVLIATSWPEFRSLTRDTFIKSMRRTLVLDPARHIESLFEGPPDVEYHGIGISR